MAVVATSAPQPELFSVAGRSSSGAARARTEELYARYARTVGGLCRALLRNPAEAEDATQQVFLSAHRALLNGSDPREPAAWLATIARNECWARIRARMREPLPTDEVDCGSSSPDPLAEAIRRADLTALWRAIEQLPKPQRDVLLMREFGGLSYDELAVALAVSTPAIESLLFRARSGLRTKLRTAYASISGFSWIDALLRLLSGSGAAAPIAAKAVALGVGAAAVTSGAVIAPHVVRSVPVRPHVARVAPQHRAAKVAPRFVAFRPATIAADHIEHARRTDGGRDTGEERPSPVATESDGEHATTTTTTVPSQPGEPPSEPQTSTVPALASSSPEDGGGGGDGMSGGVSGGGHDDGGVLASTDG